VALPGDHVEVELVAALDAERVVDEACEDAFEEDLARELVAGVLVRPGPVLLVEAVDALEEIRDPPDAALAQRKGDVWESTQHRRPRHIGGGLDDVGSAAA